MPQPVPQQPVPQQVVQPAVQQRTGGGTEPAALWTIVVLVLVAVAFVVLLAVVFTL